MYHAQGPTPAFVGASWGASLIGAAGSLDGLRNADMKAVRPPADVVPAPS